MKKSLVTMVSVLILLALTGCCFSHDWELATCTSPMTCRKCGKTDGEAMGHFPGDWEVVREATFSAPGLKQRICFVCGNAVEEEEIETSMIADGLFTFSRQDYMNCIESVLKEYGEGLGVMDQESYICAYSDHVDVLVYFLKDNEAVLKKKDAPLNVDSLLAVFATDTYRSMYISALIECCCPEIDFDTLEKAAEKIQKGEQFSCDGLYFYMGKADGYDALTITANPPENKTDSEDALATEYHWNKPVAISDEYTIGMYNDGTNYWIEISAKTRDSNSIITMLRHGTADLGFDTDNFLEWFEHVADQATDAWKTDGVSYAEMSGYGREWVVYVDLRENVPGLLGMRVNMENEFEDVVGIEVLD